MARRAPVSDGSPSRRRFIGGHLRRCDDLNPLSHTHAIFNRIAEPRIKFGDAAVRSSNLQIDFAAPQGKEPPFRFAYQRAPDALPLVRLQNRDSVKPASVTVISGHRGSNHVAARDCDKQQFGTALRKFDFSEMLERGLVSGVLVASSEWRCRPSHQVSDAEIERKL